MPFQLRRVYRSDRPDDDLTTPPIRTLRMVVQCFHCTRPATFSVLGAYSLYRTIPTPDTRINVCVAHAEEWRVITGATVERLAAPCR